MEEFNFKVPEEIPIDETVLIVVIHFKSGEEIKEGDAVFEIETSKTAYVLSSESSGVLNHQVVLGQEVKSGQVIGVVVNDQ